MTELWTSQASKQHHAFWIAYFQKPYGRLLWIRIWTHRKSPIDTGSLGLFSLPLITENFSNVQFNFASENKTLKLPEFFQFPEETQLK